MEIQTDFNVNGNVFAKITVADWELEAIGLDLLEINKCINLGRKYPLKTKEIPARKHLAQDAWLKTDMRKPVMLGAWFGCDTVQKAAPEPKHIYASDDSRVVVIIWDDGDKTIARCSEGDTPDVERGIQAAVMRKLYGPRSRYKRLFGNVERQGE